MLQKGQIKAKDVFLTVVVLLVLHLTQTEASPLKKRARWNGKKEATDVRSSFKPGVIVFGEDPKNASLEGDTSYQADHPGFISPVMKHYFESMNPELLCGNDQMRFTASGTSVRHFGMRPYPRLPLSDVPTSCGYTVEGNPLRLVFHAPYDACDTVIKDGCYELPLLWNGLPVTLKCPKPEDPTTIPPLFPWLPWPLPQETTTAAPPVFPKFPPGLHHHPWPFPQYPFHPPYQGVVLPPYFHKHPPVQSTPLPPQHPLPDNWWWWWWYHTHKFYPHPSQPTPLPPQYPLNWWDWHHTHKVPIYPTQPTSPQDSNPQLLQNYWQYLYDLYDQKSPVANQHPGVYYPGKASDGKYYTQSPTTQSTTLWWWGTPTTQPPPVSMP